MTDEQAREVLKKHAAAYGDARYEPARWVVDAIQAAVAAEREQWRHALEYAIKEADGWHDECHGGPIESKDMDAARALLGPNVRANRPIGAAQE